MKRKSKYFSALCAAVLLIAALVIPASAATSIEDQMAANSAAWWIAHNAGDTATCEALHQANVDLANQAAGSSGSATFNNDGTWNITTSSGSQINSSGSYSGGKSNTITYTTTTSNGGISSSSNSTYTSSAIDSYKNYGGTNSGLETSYNNAAAKVTSSGNYGTNIAQTTADEEVAVVQELLGLTDSEARELQAELETHKQEFESAQAAYQAAMAAGDTEAAAAAKQQMNDAHEAAESARAEYNYTGDTADVEDGGYYDDWGNPVSPTYYGGGGFFVTSTYRITSSCNEGGTITPNGVTTVRRGASQAYAIKANDGYMIKSVVVDGIDKGSINQYAFTNVSSTHTITVTFAKKTLEIAASCNEGGTISPSGSVKVEYGKSKTFDITPDEGYKIKSVVVDGSNKGAISNYTFENVTSGHTITVTFEKKSYSITASAGTGGTISPAGNVTVSYGDSKSFSITPDEGYKVASVVVDGVNKGELTTYTFSNIKSAHTISATFIPSGTIDIGTPDVTDGDGNDIGGGADGDGIKSGYGIFAEVAASYDDVEDLKMTVTYNFGDGSKTVVMEETSEGCFQYPVNADSPTGKRCIYIPVDTADGSYTLTFTLTAKNAASEELTETTTATVVVNGAMYEDDFTGDS